MNGFISRGDNDTAPRRARYQGWHWAGSGDGSVAGLAGSGVGSDAGLRGSGVGPDVGLRGSGVGSDAGLLGSGVGSDAGLRGSGVGSDAGSHSAPLRSPNADTASQTGYNLAASYGPGGEPQWRTFLTPASKGNKKLLHTQGENQSLARNPSGLAASSAGPPSAGARQQLILARPERLGREQRQAAERWREAEAGLSASGSGVDWKTVLLSDPTTGPSAALESRVAYQGTYEDVSRAADGVTMLYGVPPICA